MKPSRRSWWSAAALLAVVLVVTSAGCGKTTPYAATVNGQRISEDTLLDEVEVLRKSPEVLSAFTGQPPAADTGSKGTASAEVTAAWLTRLIRQEAVDADFRERKLSISAEKRREVENSFEQALGGDSKDSKWKALPAWFRDRLIDRQARLEALLDATATAPTEAQQKAYYEQNKDQICPSGNLVYHILVASEADAKKAAARIEGGEPFAEVAKAVSTDTSAQSGGLVGCAGAGTFVPEFEKVAADLKPGQVSKPVKTQFGWHVITVKKITFEAVEGEIVRALESQGQNKFGEKLRQQLEKAKISVNSRFGTWDRDQLQVNPPKAPKPKSRPATTSSTTPVSGSPVPGGTPTPGG